MVDNDLDDADDEGLNETGTLEMVDNGFYDEEEVGINSVNKTGVLEMIDNGMYNRVKYVSVELE